MYSIDDSEDERADNKQAEQLITKTSSLIPEGLRENTIALRYVSGLLARLFLVSLPPPAVGLPALWRYTCAQCDYGINERHALRLHKSGYHMGAQIYVCSFPGCEQLVHYQM